MPTLKTLEIASSGTRPLATCLQPYDIMKDMENLHLRINMRQLLTIAPQCCTKLLAMIHKRSKIVKVNDITISDDIELNDPLINLMTLN